MNKAGEKMKAQSEMWLQIEKNGRMAGGREVEGQGRTHAPVCNWRRALVNSFLTVSRSGVG
jgi:hypothetical protein